MKNIEDILQEMRLLLEEAKKFALDFLSFYQNGTAEIPPTSPRSNFTHENISYDKLDSTLKQDIEIVDSNLSKIILLEEKLKVKQLKLYDSQFDNFTKHTRSLISSAGWCSQISAEGTTHYTDRVSSYVHNRMETYRATFDRLMRKLFKNHKYSGVKLLDVGFYDETQFDTALTGITENPYIKAVRVSVDLMSFEVGSADISGVIRHLSDRQ